MASNRNTAAQQLSRYIASKLTRHDFDPDFLWGAATSAYQVEGAYSDGRKSLNVWDVFSQQRPGKIADGSNGCLAIDHYNRVQEDVGLMKKLGLDSYRFSISWSRILPAGKLSGGVNREGVKFYNCLIDTLISQGIEPFVTIFHWDVPQCLQDLYGGFLSPQIVNDFADFAQVCFFEFGDRVKFWVTQNEPWTFTHSGYVAGGFPPAHGSESGQAGEQHHVKHRGAPGVDLTCEAGDAGTEPYIVAHHLLLAHATAVDIYRRNFQGVQGGKIGVTNVSEWFDPFTQSQEDIQAASRAVDFMWGWFVAPIVTGDYPPIMRELVGDRLPTFTPLESKLLKGSFDFLGMNYYTTKWAANKPNPPGAQPNYDTDRRVDIITKRGDEYIGPQAASSWLFVVPHGIYELLVHTKNTYNDPIIYITENGVDERNDRTKALSEALDDEDRINYLVDHFAYMKLAIDQGVKLKGHFVWSLFDNYEWAEGYKVRFGLYYVDYANGLNRYPKKSAIWLMKFLNKNLLPTGSKREVQEIEDTPASAKKRKAR